MEIKKQIDGFLQKDVDRKEFLTQVGVAGLAAFGVSGVIKSLSGGSRAQGNGYGSSSYGGGDRKLGRINRKIG